MKIAKSIFYSHIFLFGVHKEKENKNIFLLNNFFKKILSLCSWNMWKPP